jgi:hypothetical protein
MYFDPAEEQYRCFSCGERFDETIDRNRRQSFFLAIPPEKRHVDTDIHGWGPIAEFVGFSEKYFKQTGAKPSPYCPTSHFHVYIDPDNTVHAYTGSLSVGKARRDAEVESYKVRSQESFTVENRIEWTTVTSGSANVQVRK